MGCEDMASSASTTTTPVLDFHSLMSALVLSPSSLSSSSSSSFLQPLAALEELRRLAKHSSSYRSLIGDMGFIPYLIDLLLITTTTNIEASASPASSSSVQSHAVAALLNLTLRNDRNKGLIVESGGVPAIASVLEFSPSGEARESAAAAIFSLSCVEGFRVEIGAHTEVFCGLVKQLREGTPRGRRDAAAALYNLSSVRQNRGHAVKAGAVESLLQLAAADTTTMNNNNNNLESLGLVNESLTVLCSLAAHRDGRIAIKNAAGVRILADLIARAAPETKEYATATLSLLVDRDSSYAEDVRMCGVAESLSDLTRTGSDRAKRKAFHILHHIAATT